MTILELGERHRRVGLDSNVIVYLLEAVEPWARATRTLLGAIEAGRLGGVISAIGLAEVCSGPAMQADFALVERYAEAIGSIPGLRIQSITAEIAADAAIIRGFRRMSLADAMHLASARASGATAFVTNDRRMRGSPNMEVVYLDDLV